MNIQLSGTEEYIDGKSTGSLGQVLIRFVFGYAFLFQRVQLLLLGVREIQDEQRKNMGGEEKSICYRDPKIFARPVLRSAKAPKKNHERNPPPRAFLPSFPSNCIISLTDRHPDVTTYYGSRPPRVTSKRTPRWKDRFALPCNFFIFPPKTAGREKRPCYKQSVGYQ